METVQKFIHEDFNGSSKRIIINDQFFMDEKMTSLDKISFYEEIFVNEVRQKQIDFLRQHFKSIPMGRYLTNLEVLGMPGTGKTLCIEYFLEAMKKVCMEHNISLHPIYVFLGTKKQVHRRSYFDVLNELCVSLGLNSRLYRIGHSQEFRSKIILKMENTNPKDYYIFVIDEMDSVKEELDSLLLFLGKELYFYSKAKIGTCIITNDFHWDDKLDSKTKSVFKKRTLIFPPYNAFEITKILKKRIELSCDTGLIEEAAVHKCAAITSRFNGDCRYALDLFYTSCLLAESKQEPVTEKSIDEAETTLELNKLHEIVSNLSRHHQLVLLSLISCANSHELYVKEVYEKYCNFSDKLGIKRLTVRRYGDLVYDLEQINLFSVQTISKGRFGRTRQIKLTTNEEVNKLIEENIFNNFNKVNL